MSRPEPDQARVPLKDIVHVSNGEQHAFGRRYRKDADDILRLVRK